MREYIGHGSYLRGYIKDFHLNYMGVNRKTCPIARAEKPLIHALERRGSLHTACRALSSGYKRLRILMVLEGLSRQARPCYVPLVSGYVAYAGPGLV